jgi:hypothetical protein
MTIFVIDDPENSQRYANLIFYAGFTNINRLIYFAWGICINKSPLSAVSFSNNRRI